MRRVFVLSMLIALAMICSCQKQDAGTEAELAKRKVEKAVDEREKAVAEREKAVANTRIVQPRTQTLNAAQAEAERQRRIQQLPPEVKAFILDRSRMDAAKAEKDRAAQQRAVQTQAAFEDARPKKIPPIAEPAAEAPEAEATSQVPSPTPQ
jgi:hypothetical protein